jgi:hypothetical protein
MNDKVLITVPHHKEKKGQGKGIINENIPQLPFTVAIIGPRHRGKTVLLRHLLSKEKGMYGSFFKPENILLYSPTYALDVTLHDLKLKNVFSPPHRMPHILDEVISQQEEFRKSDNMLPVLVVMEDITQIQDAWLCLERLGYTGRHYNVHSLAVGHKLSSVPRGVRTQTQQWILFRPNEQSEWQWILDMFSRKKTQAVWTNALRRCWSEDHQFAYIDFERKDFQDIYRCGFNSPLFTPDEEKEMEFGAIYYNPLKRRKVPEEGLPQQKLTDTEQIAKLVGKNNP